MAQGRFWDFVIVQSGGNFIIEYRFLEELENFYRSNSNFFLLAFPPTPQVDEGGALEFDSRMMVVNVDAWGKLGYPGLDEEEESLPSVLDSASADRAIHAVRRQSFLDAVIARGLAFHEFPESLSNCSVYVRPEFESSRLYKGLVNLDESLVSDFGQKRWIHLSIPRSTIWIYNSEPYRFNVPLHHCDAYFGPAAGFKYLDMLSYNPNAEFLFYDQNDESLEWVETLKSNWDGSDFANYVNCQPEGLRRHFKYVNSSMEQNQRLLYDDFGGEEGFKSLWRLFRSAKARFVKCDLFNSCDVRELMSKTKATRPFFYYSNIFSTIFTLSTLSREEAEERYTRFKSIVMSRFPTAIMHGADVSGAWH
jgi:hypothetical protein